MKFMTEFFEKVNDNTYAIEAYMNLHLTYWGHRPIQYWRLLSEIVYKTVHNPSRQAADKNVILLILFCWILSNSFDFPSNILYAFEYVRLSSRV